MPLGTRTTSNQPDACLKRKMLHLLQITIRYLKLCGVNTTQLEKTNVEMQQALRVKNTNISLKKKVARIGLQAENINVSDKKHGGCIQACGHELC
jgi:hypothetical protein